jgi:predicted RNA polymerase sigma factor
MVALNHAIALAMVHGPAAGLARLDDVSADSRITGHYRLDAVRAHLLERAGEHDGAIAPRARCRAPGWADACTADRVLPSIQ